MPYEPEPTVWLHPDVDVRSSKIEGSGLFALRDIPASSTVIRLGGDLVDTAVLNNLLDQAEVSGTFVDTVQLTADCHLVLPAGSPAHFGNHSCDPNLWHSGPFDLVARRDLRADGELTIDYGTSSILESFSMPCTCMSAACRGFVTGNDWQLPDLQRRYKRHWVPAAVEAIAAVSKPDT